jgi:glycerol-3-phosphate dehydrogenase (NAD(P)+)
VTTVSILGSGIMATALTWPLAENGHEIRLVGTHLDREIIDSIKSTGVHPGLDLKVPDAVTAYQLEDAQTAFDGAEIVMSGVNSFGVRWAGEQLAGLLRPGQKLIAIAKGMVADDNGDLHILPDVLAAQVPAELRDAVTWTAIAGPSIAGEVAVKRHTCVVFTSRTGEVLDELAATFRTPAYHVWTSTDFVGVEVCAAMKNCYALAVGFADGVLDRLGDTNARYRNFNFAAALFAQGAREMFDMMQILGGDPWTPSWLPGVGDEYVTSAGGRNVKVGRLIGSGLRFSEAKAQMPGVTLEGAAAIDVIGGALTPLTERGVIGKDDFPLLRHLYEVIGLDQPLDMPWSRFFAGPATPSFADAIRAETGD